jgi:hypothetical protein
MRQPALLGFLLVAILARSASGAVQVAVSAEDGVVYVDARSTGLLDADIERSLRSGLPARVRIELAVWERRAGLWDRDLVREGWGVSVLFDLIDESYEVYDDTGELVLGTSELQEVEEFVAGVALWPVCTVDRLAADREHYVTAEFGVEPLSIEEVRDLEQWLRGNVRQGGRGLRDVPGQLVGILRSRIGLGERVERGRSRSFRAADLPNPD